MNTYQTLEAAREAAPVDAQRILKIEHATEGKCFIAAKAPVKIVKRFMAEGHLPEIKTVYEEYSMAAPAPVSYDPHCYTCRAELDPATAKSGKVTMHLRSAKMEVTVHYCSHCVRMAAQYAH